jgi:hypothetical protein
MPTQTIIVLLPILVATKEGAQAVVNPGESLSEHLPMLDDGALSELQWQGAIRIDDAPDALPDSPAPLEHDDTQGDAPQRPKPTTTRRK